MTTAFDIFSMVGVELCMLALAVFTFVAFSAAHAESRGRSSDAAASSTASEAKAQECSGPKRKDSQASQRLQRPKGGSSPKQWCQVPLPHLAVAVALAMAAAVVVALCPCAATSGHSTAQAWGPGLEPEQDVGSEMSTVVAQPGPAPSASLPSGPGQQRLHTACEEKTLGGQWEDPPSANELLAAFDCHRGKLAEFSFDGTHGDAASHARSDARNDAVGDSNGNAGLLLRGRQLVHVLEALLERCGTISQEMIAIQVLQQNVGSLQLEPSDATAILSQHAASLFEGLRELELPYRSGHAALAQGIRLLEADSSGSVAVHEVLGQLLDARTAARDCLLKAVREARVLSMVLAGRRPLECGSGSLAGVEALAVHEGKAEDNADTLFDLAMYQSIASVMASEASACFQTSSSDTSMVRDVRGVFVPGNIAEAEESLLQAEQRALGESRTQRAISRASRLYAHANFLAAQHSDAAAEWRYEAAASLLAAGGEHKQAADSLSHLGAMLLLRNRRKEALVAVEAALAQHDEDPLARYLQVFLQLSSGQVRSGAEVRTAAEELRALVDYLPWRELEGAHDALLEELALWDEVAEEGASRCLQLPDAAKVLICLFGRLAF